MTTSTGRATCEHTPGSIDHARRVLDLTRLNLPLIEKVRDYIATHPEEHDQTVLARRRPSCGTAMCFAGWAAHFTGHSFDWDSRAVGAEAVYLIDGRFIWDAARNDLGLTALESSALFNEYNDLADIDWLIERITNGAIPATDPSYNADGYVHTWWTAVEDEQAEARRVLDKVSA